MVDLRAFRSKLLVGLNFFMNFHGFSRNQVAGKLKVTMVTGVTTRATRANCYFRKLTSNVELESFLSNNRNFVNEP